MTAGKGNLEQVRAALEGITGHAPIIEKPTPGYAMIIARGGRELDAVDSYRRLGVAACWPSYEELRATRRKVNGHPVCSKSRLAVVPGYVFPEFVPGCFDLEVIIGAIDVVRGCEGKPLHIREIDMKIIRGIEENKNTPKPGNSEHRFKIGDRVRFTDDITREWPPGTIKALARQGRITIEVSLMGRKVDIKAFPHQIERM
jgi:transcription antitermination factor NusG